MKEDVQGRRWNRKPLWVALGALAVLLAVVIVPPLVSISRYKSRITNLMAEALGRPVRLSSVEMRLFPVPGFVLTDLTVEEDPAYGAEPILHANTVKASIRLLSLWRGRLEIGTISVDEASLNVVRTAEGRWNLDPLFRTAAAKAQPAAGASGQGGKRVTPLPYLEATNSRINFKRGAEKLPFSVVETDLSFWQEQPGDWRIRLKGQPARTDLSLDLADTGLVRLEARVRRAPELRQMPLHVDMEWREAQLGQLARLLIGSDPGWRGDLTGELHLDGTPDAAQVQTRLRAIGVHRAEFAPVAPMDFDASCSLLYHFSERSLEKLACDSPLGDGRIKLAGEVPGKGASPQISLELDRIPVAAGLDALRTVRSDFGPGLEARGAVSGKISYAAVPPDAATQESKGERHVRGKAGAKAQAAKPHAEPGPLTGSFTVEGLQLSGGGLGSPIQAAKLVLEPVTAPALNEPAGARHSALETTVSIAAGAPSPLVVVARLARSGYQLTVHGQASVVRARELAHVAGMANASVLDALAGDPVGVDLSAAGPWLPAVGAPFPSDLPAAAAAQAVKAPLSHVAGADVTETAASDSLIGTVVLRNANWKVDYLANHVEIAQATLHLENGELDWDPVVFAYGPVKGTASLHLPAKCETDVPCLPKFAVQFGDLDAGLLQAAILGAHEPGTLLSTLLARLKPAGSDAAPNWPRAEGTVQADSLALGPVKLEKATATLRIGSDGAEIAGLDANLLGGQVHGGGTLRTPRAGQDKPAYTLEGHFEKLSPADVGKLLGLPWAGRSFDADGKIDLSGYTDKDLAASAKGTLHFDWRHGAMSGPRAAADQTGALARFDRWTADAEIAQGTVTLKQNQVQTGARKRGVEATLTFGSPPTLALSTPGQAVAKPRESARR